MNDTQDTRFCPARGRRKKRMPEQPEFNFFSYAKSFDFCDRGEFLLLHDTLKQSWSWAYPPTGQEQDERQEDDEPVGADVFETSERVKKKYLEYERYRLRKKDGSHEQSAE